MNRVKTSENFYFKNNPKNASKNFSSLFYISRACGLLPLNDKFKITFFWKIYSILVIFTYLTISIYCLTLFYGSDMDWLDDHVNFYFFIILNAIQFLTILTHLHVCIRKENELQTILDEMNESKKCPSVYVGILWIFGCNLSWTILQPDSDIVICVFANLVLSANESLLFVIILQFCSFLEITGHNFEKNTNDIKMNFSIFAVLKRQEGLVEKAFLVNNFYSKQILLICTSSFLDIVSYSYYTIDKFLDDKIIVGTVILQMSLFEIYKLIRLSKACSDAQNKAGAFNGELFRSLMNSKTLSINERLSLYMSKRETLSFSACGFFPLGYPLVTSIVAAATTYLVIFVQLGQRTT